jgi:hypothetical protein
MIGMILGLGSLLAWFFLARVTLYAHSSEILLSDNGRILATFPGETFGQIRPGQAGVLRMKDPTSGKIAPIPLLVFSLDKEKQQAEILVMENNLPVGFTDAVGKGEVNVEIDRITPFSLVMQSSGLAGNQGDVTAGSKSNGGR